MIQDGFFLGTQYFRPPFPRAAGWDDDLRRIRGAGLDTIVVWLVWGWCEPEPGGFVFDDYDRLLDLTEKHQLRTVLSLLPEVNPFWVPRVIPDAQMIDVNGSPVAGGSRLECLSGTVPGGCSDHPVVRTHMERFIERAAAHFAPRDGVRAWDVWNENRWRNGGDESVCFCNHSLRSFRAFLRERYGSLDALGEAWGRRMADWADVRVGPRQSCCYPEMHDFLGWLTKRNQDMIRWRLAALRRGDPRRLAGSHTSSPSVCGGIALKEDIFARGIDWDVARGDFYGLSLFPDMNGPTPIPPIDIAARFTAAASAAGNRPCWLSELQGGPVVVAGKQSPPLDADRQQAWVWLAVSRGLRAAMYWCWQPEIFGMESGGFGVLTPDGLADDRVAATRRTAGELAQSGIAEHAFAPIPPRVGVLFQRDAYWRNWMQSREYTASMYNAPDELLGHLRALELLNVPYVVLDDRHAEQWRHHENLKLIIVPDADSLNDAAAENLVLFAHGGGSVWVEGGPGRFGDDTYLRPSTDWPLLKAACATQALHRRTQHIERVIPAGALNNTGPILLRFGTLETGWSCVSGAAHELLPDSLPALAIAAAGDGQMAIIGSAVAGATWRGAPQQMTELVRALLHWASVTPPLTINTSEPGWCTGRLGYIGDRASLLLVNFGPAQRVDLAWDASFGGKRAWRDTNNAIHPVRIEADQAHLSLELPEFGRVLLSYDDPASVAGASLASQRDH